MGAALKAPFPWFGGKSSVAAEVWSEFGDTPNYVEPFCGSAAMLLARDCWQDRIETINDADGYVANFWRTMVCDPEAVAHWSDWPVNEIDLHARHGWLINRRPRLLWSLEDPDYYDAKIAGWWLWGMCIWIGSGFCSGEGPWVSTGAHVIDSRKLPHLGDAGQGINRQLPHLGNAGQAWAHLRPIAERLRNVRVCCGDWLRVLGPTPTTKRGTTSVFLDPPYAVQDRAECYSTESFDVAVAVREWCEKNGSNSELRIALCGYVDEGHADLEQHGWRRWTWKSKGGYASQGDGSNKNTLRECIWFSPACLG